MGKQQQRLQTPPPSQTPPAPPPARPSCSVGPATLDVFSQVLANADVSRAQILTLMESRGLTGNYRLLIEGARLVPSE